MILAVHNGGRPPAWVGALVLAEKWGSMPWSITGETDTNDTRRKWYLRGVLYYSQINKRDEIRQREIEAQYGR